ncbi:hypothetical protein AWB95_14715 [Mycobacterium celatum]|uniref:K(+)-transporting ATPase subunit F n=1 Tax=Mycobacterium celatum TaxID=28045 RepID=A0A1X1RQ33_MYCCE|nr:hypothetical protein AWB95_14715 [Mycobacterium celatum]PIB77935.1 K(+)-transporting ATPase subunit F [Mycobacterium celatum]
MLRERSRCVCGGLSAVDGRGLRAARRGAQVSGAAVNLANAVGLVLATAMAVFLVAALLFPDRF